MCTTPKHPGLTPDIITVPEVRFYQNVDGIVDTNIYIYMQPNSLGYGVSFVHAAFNSA